MTPARLTTWLRWGLIIIVAVMPFHAFLSVWLGSLTGHPSLIQSWKEAVTVCLIIGSAWLLWRQPVLFDRLRHPVSLAALAFIFVSLVITAVIHPDAKAVLFGIKTDLEFIALFFIAVLVGDKPFLVRLAKVLLTSSLIAAGVAVLLGLVLPPTFLSHFGYGPTTIEPFRLVDPAIKTIRTPGTLGGPNQLGSFMILPLCVMLGLAVRRWRWRYAPGLILLTGALWVSYSRSAILGAVAAVIATLAFSLPLRKSLSVLGAGLVTAFVVLLLLINLTSFGHRLPYYVLHATQGTEDRNNSTTLHNIALHAGLKQAAAHPWGEGLGSSGPASYNTPTPSIPENYYLQLAIETGYLGAGIFVVFIAAVFWQLIRLRRRVILAGSIAAALLGLSIVNLFLHGWADSSTAFVFWIIAGTVIGEGWRVQTTA